MKKRLFSIILTMALMTTLVCSCGSKSSESALYPRVDMGGKPVTITYMTIGDKPTNGQTEVVVEQLNKILEKELNARLDVFYISWNDYLDNYDQTLDEGSVDIDLVGTGTDWLDAWPNVVKGNFLPMSEEMINTYCPRTYAHVSQEEWEACKYNDQIYFIPENEYSQWTNHGFIYRGDIAREAGLEGVNSWEDLTSYFSYVKENKPDMIPWDAKGDNTIISLGYLMSKSDYVPIYEITTYGLWGAYKHDMTKITSPFYKGDELIEFATLMKQWGKMGVWRGDFAIAGDNDSELYAGLTSVEQHHTQKYYDEIKPNLELTQIGSDAGFYWFGKESGNVLRTSILHGAMAVYSGSKNPERALMVYDYLRNDETCYRLMCYGINGVQYELLEDGSIEKPNGYNPDKDSMTLNFWWGRRDEYELRDSGNAWDDYQELVKEYEKTAIDYPWDQYPFGAADINDRIRRINRVCARYLPEIVYGTYRQTPEEEVAEFREQLRLVGFELVTKELQKILDSH